MQPAYNPYAQKGQSANLNKPQPGLPAYTEAWALIESARGPGTGAD